MMINSVGRKSLNIYTIVALNTTAVKPFGRNTNLSDVTDIPTPPLAQERYEFHKRIYQYSYIPTASLNLL